MASQYIILLDINSGNVTGTAASVDPAGNVCIEAAVGEPHRDNVRYGSVVNVEETRLVTQRVLEALGAHPALSQRRVCGVFLAIGGRSLTSSVVQAKATFPAETLVTMDILQSLTRQARERFYGSTRLLSLTPRAYVVNGLPAPNPKGMYAMRIEASYNAVTCSERLHRGLTRVFETLDYEVQEPAIVRPLAEGQYLLTDDERRLGVMLVDLGAETTTVSIYRAGTLQYLVTLPLGGRNITRDLTTLGLTEEEAERIKCAQGNAMPQIDTQFVAATTPQGVNRVDIDRYIGARALEIAANVANQLTLSGITAEQLPSGIVITGGASAMPNINRLLENQCNMHVRRATLPHHVTLAEPHLTAVQAPVLASLCLAASKITTTKSCTTSLVKTPSATANTHAPANEFDIDEAPRTQPATAPQTAPNPAAGATKRPENIDLMGQDPATPDGDDGDEQPYEEPATKGRWWPFGRKGPKARSDERPTKGPSIIDSIFGDAPDQPNE